MPAVEIGGISVVYYELLGVVVAFGLLVGALVAPHIARPVTTFKRLLVVGGVLLLVGTLLPVVYVPGYEGVINVVWALLTYLGLFLVAVAVGIVLYHILWVSDEVAAVKKLLSAAQPPT